MTKLSGIYPFALLLSISLPVNAGQITDTYASGDTLTASKMTNIKKAVNANDTSITDNAFNITTNTNDIATNAANISVLQSSQGYVFTRWGNGAAPGNTSLVYSGYAFASQYTSAGNQEPIVVAQNGTTSALTNNGYLYPLKIGFAITGSSLVSLSHVMASVNISPTPVVTMWGGASIPAGWRELYRGYAYGGHNTHSGGIAKHICVDDAGFQSNLLLNSLTSSSAIYPVNIPPIGADLPAGYTSSNVLTCIVMQKI